MRHCPAVLLVSAGSLGFSSLSAQTVVGLPQRPVLRSTSPASTGTQINPNQSFDTRPAGAAPTVTVTAVSPSEIRVTWNAVPGAVGYLVRRNPATTPQLLTPAAISATELVDKELYPNTTTGYEVWADFGPESSNSPGRSNIVTATTPPPVNPSGFSASSRASGTSSSPSQQLYDTWLRWNPAPGAAYYSVKSNGQLVYEGANPSAGLRGVPEGEHSYDLLAYYGPTGAAIADTSTPAHTYGNAYPLPNLVASVTGPGAVTLSWDPVSGAASYGCERQKMNLQTGVLDAYVTVGMYCYSPFTDNKGLSPGTTYRYRVLAQFKQYGHLSALAHVTVTLPP